MRNDADQGINLPRANDSHPLPPVPGDVFFVQVAEPFLHLTTMNDQMH
jgi:hypothetical protein